MEGQNFSENYSYMECIQSVANFFKEGKYTATLMALKNIERNYSEENWKHDLGIMLSESSDDFWSNLCIFNLCSAGAEGCCESGCGWCCCGMACVASIVEMCCGGDGGYCLANMIIKPIECCCGCCQADCCCE